MKAVFSIVISCLFSLSTLHAQLAVYDPVVHAQQVIDQAQNLAKYVEMVNNQVQQIQTLTSQLDELQKYNEAFGNPARLLQIVGVNGLIRDLEKTPVGKTIGQLQDIAEGVDALIYDANGLYKRIGETFTTPAGAEIPRTEADYRPYAAINKTTENYTNVVADVLQRRKALKEEIAATTQKLQSATTDAEVQKLSGVLISLNSALAATDNEIEQALNLTLIQDAENRNDREKQSRARAEEQQAEFGESFENYGNTFRLSSEPPLFPEK